MSYVCVIHLLCLYGTYSIIIIASLTQTLKKDIWAKDDVTIVWHDMRTWQAPEQAGTCILSRSPYVVGLSVLLVWYIRVILRPKDIEKNG